MRKRILIIVVLGLINITYSQNVENKINLSKTIAPSEAQVFFKSDKLSPYTSLFLADKYNLNKKGCEKVYMDSLLTANYHLINKNEILYAHAFLLVDETINTESLLSIGILPNYRIGRYQTALIPINEITDIATHDFIHYIHIGEPVKFMMDSCRSQTNADKVINGSNLLQAYNGKNVVVGIIDGGFDYTHPTFYDNAGTTLRIKRVWEQNANSGTHPNGFNYGRELSTPTSIINAQCDSPNETHGTHVAGIVAGSGGTTTLAKQYKGISPMSDIVMVSTDFSDVSILNGIIYIIDYAQSVGKPCVINMSLGKHLGPHDGTSFFDQFCDTIVELSNAILVGAAGNEGAYNIHLKGKGIDPYTYSFIESYITGAKCIDIIDIWGEDTNASFGITVNLYNINTDNIESYTYTINPRNGSYNGLFNLLDNDPLFKDTLKVFISTEINPYNNKPHAIVQIDNTDQDDNYRYALLEITNYSTSSINMWCTWQYDYCYFANKDYYYPVQSGDTAYTVGEIGGTSKSIISVGAYNSKTQYASINNQTYIPDCGILKDIADFSSHGPTVDDRMKPDITAPGATLVSSYNSFYSASSDKLVYGLSKNNKTWYYGTMEGTSMASPTVTGIIALWLEAYPYLTIQQAKNIMQATANQDVYYNSAYTWGYGKINAYAGLQFLLSKIPPKPQIIANKTSACIGDTIILSAPNGFTEYYWSTGDTTQTIQIRTSGQYYVACINSEGYISPFDTIKVTFNAQPTTPTIQVNGTLLTSNYIHGNQWYFNNNLLIGDTLQTYNAKQSGKYSLQVTNLMGCTSDMANVDIDTSNKAPDKPIITPSGSIFLCEGDTVILKAPDDFQSYEWSNGARTQQIVVSKKGNYAVRVYNEFNYYSLWSDTTNVDFYSKSPAPTITKVDNILYSDYDSGNQWYYERTPIQDATGKSYKVMKNGLYSLTIIDTNGCISSMKDMYVEIDNNISEMPNNMPYHIYPNPSKGIITIQYEALEEINNIQITDIVGRNVGFIQNQEGNNTILLNLQNLTNGIYCIHIYTKNKLYIHKIILLK